MSISFFSPPFNKTLHSNGTHPSSKRSSRKRKRSGCDSNDVLNDQSSGFYSNSSSTGSPDGIIASSPPLRGQQLEARHRANEQPLDLGILGKNFPHAKPSRKVEDSASEVKSELHDTLGGAKPRLPFQSTRRVRDDLVRDIPRSMGFRQQHLTSLTTILHKCVLDGDYVRAGRAWGMLLRTEVNGRSMDIRTHDRWGFGAEILCRRRLQPIESSSIQKRSLTSEDDSRVQALLNRKKWFGGEGFEMARGYYERLILQHPYRIASPRALGALDFYPAMLGLWIYSEQEQYGLSLKFLREADTKLVQDPRKLEHTSKRNPSPRPRTQAQLQQNDINKAFLRRGQEIAARLDELLVSPPFSDSTRLWNLRHLVDIWIEDFSVTTLRSESKPNFRLEQCQL